MEIIKVEIIVIENTYITEKKILNQKFKVDSLK